MTTTNRNAHGEPAMSAVPEGTAWEEVPADEGAGDAQPWGDGWQIIGPEPRGIHDLVLVDADVS